MEQESNKKMTQDEFLETMGNLPKLCANGINEDVCIAVAEILATRLLAENGFVDEAKSFIVALHDIRGVARERG